MQRAAVVAAELRAAEALAALHRALQDLVHQRPALVDEVPLQFLVEPGISGHLDQHGADGAVARAEGG